MWRKLGLPVPSGQNLRKTPRGAIIGSMTIVDWLTVAHVPRSTGRGRWGSTATLLRARVFLRRRFPGKAVLGFPGARRGSSARAAFISFATPLTAQRRRGCLPSLQNQGAGLKYLLRRAVRRSVAAYVYSGSRPSEVVHHRSDSGLRGRASGSRPLLAH